MQRRALFLPKARDLVRERRYHLAVGSLAGGIGSAVAAPEVRMACAAAMLALLASLRASPLALICVLLFLGGGLAGDERLEAIDAPGLMLRSESRVGARSYLLERPRQTRFGWRAEVRVISGPASGARLLARTSRGTRWPNDADVGSELLVDGRVRRPRAREGERFDFAEYLRRRGVAGELWLSRVRATGLRRGGLHGHVDSMRRRAERALARGLAPRTAALLRGMVLGQDDLIDEATRDDWRASGLAHLLAVSGQNVMLLAALALPLLAAVRLPPRGRAAAVAGLIALYVPLAGAGPSLQRAAVMGAASLAAVCLARPASRWYALLLAVAVTLALNPRAHGDPGWQLSFAAVAGILVLAPRLRGGLAKVLPRLLAEGVAVTVAATLATAPLLAYSFGSVPLLGLPANVLALPLVAPIMWLGMIRAALGQLIPAESAPLGPVAATASLANDPAGAAIEPLTGALAALAAALADLPGAQLSLPRFPAELVAAAYVAIAIFALALAAGARRAEPALQVAGAAWRRRPRAHRAAAVCALSLAAALGVAQLVRAPPAPRSLTVSFLDVGQGDATLIQDPRGTAVLFDGGPPEARVARLLRRAGVRRLSALVMTHASRDHHGGLREVVERYPVDLLIDGGDGARDRDFRSTVEEAVRRGARRLEAVAPMAVRLGALRIQVVSPRPRPPGPAPEDPNPRAVVAIVSSGDFDLLLSADAESPTLSGLHLPPVEAMKVPHHGSRDPGLPDVLDRIRPKVAAIPVGENSYGHPAPSTLAAMRAAKLFPHRTDREGTIRVIVEGGTMRVAPEHGDGVAGEP